MGNAEPNVLLLSILHGPQTQLEKGGPRKGRVVISGQGGGCFVDWDEIGDQRTGTVPGDKTAINQGQKNLKAGRQDYCC